MRTTSAPAVPVTASVPPETAEKAAAVTGSAETVSAA
jgi:hypothetical protein